MSGRQDGTPASAEAADGTGVTITEASSDDLDHAVELFLGYFDFYGRRHDRADVAAFVADRQRAGESLLLLAWPEGAARGSAPEGMAHVYPTYSTLALAPAWTLNDLYVAPDGRRSGIARALIREVRDRARRAGAVEVVLETARDNASARALYEAEGYEAESGDFLHYTLPLR